MLVSCKFPVHFGCFLASSGAGSYVIPLDCLITLPEATYGRVYRDQQKTGPSFSIVRKSLILDLVGADDSVCRRRPVLSECQGNWPLRQVWQMFLGNGSMKVMLGSLAVCVCVWGGACCESSSLDMSVLVEAMFLPIPHGNHPQKCKLHPLSPCTALMHLM